MTNLALCELAAVKRRLSITDTANDAALTALIDSVSVAIERYLDRKLYSEERTEYYNVTNRRQEVVLRAYPVATIASVKNSASWDWDNVTAIAAAQYDADDESGLLYVKQNLAVGRRALQIVYTAGIGTTAAGVATAHPDLAIAAEMQVADEFVRRDSLGTVQFNLTDGGGTGYQSGVALLPGVRERLAPWRRRLV